MQYISNHFYEGRLQNRNRKRKEHGNYKTRQMEKRFQEDVEDKSKTIREMKIKLKQAQKNNGQ